MKVTCLHLGTDEHTELYRTSTAVRKTLIVFSSYDQSYISERNMFLTNYWFIANIKKN